MKMKADIQELSESLETLANMAKGDPRLAPEYKDGYLHVASMVRDWCRRTLQDEEVLVAPLVKADLEVINRQLAPMSRRRGGNN